MSTSQATSQVRGVGFWCLVGAVGLGLAVGLVVATSTVVPTAVDPGATVRYGLPVARAVLFVSAVATVGLSILPLLLGFKRPKLTEPVMRPARTAAVVSSAVWAFSSLVVLLLLVAEVRPDRALSVDVVLEFVSKVGVGQALIFSAVVAVLYLAAAVMAVRSGESVPAELRLVLSLFGMLPLPVGGHASNFGLLWGGHGLTMLSMELHIMSASLWTGGLTALVVFTAAHRALLAATLPRFSKLATNCLAVVALTGVINALVSLLTTPGVTLPGALVTSEYGLLLVLKTVCLVALAALGARIRFRLMPRISGHQPVPFVTWAAVEIAVMGIAFGLAIILARTGIG